MPERGKDRSILPLPRPARALVSALGVTTLLALAGCGRDPINISNGPHELQTLQQGDSETCHTSTQRNNKVSIGNKTVDESHGSGGYNGFPSNISLSEVIDGQMQARLLTNDNSYNIRPALVGNKVVFISGSNYMFQLSIKSVDIQTGQIQTVVQPETVREGFGSARLTIGSFNVNPIDHILAYSVLSWDNLAGVSGIYTVGLGGEGNKKILDGGETRDRFLDPSWSPQGDRLAFIRQRIIARNVTEKNGATGTDYSFPGDDLYIANKDGSGIKLVAKAPQDVHYQRPLWAAGPDGDMISFTGDYSYKQMLKRFIAKPDGQIISC